ncbi:MAG TPA: DinB family protein [Bacteroidota bacterium]
MNETAEHYTKRILGYLRGNKPMSVLASTPGSIERLISNVPANRLRIRTEPRRWSAVEILAHLADSELVLAFRLRLILGSNRVAIPAYNQDKWAQFSKYRQTDPQKSLERFKVLREANVDLLRTIPKTMWNYYGMHSERGKETITRMVEMFAGHDRNHIVQLQKLLSAAKSK